MGNFVPSLIRTYVPIGVAWLAGWLLTLSVDVPSDGQKALATGVGAVLAGIYYALVRAAEKRWPVLGVLLGSTSQPQYVSTTSSSSGNHLRP
ncbi:MAG: hypothetical protein ACRDQA_15755 [Nocardioidaceae bacterium]